LFFPAEKENYLQIGVIVGAIAGTCVRCWQYFQVHCLYKLTCMKH